MSERALLVEVWLKASGYRDSWVSEDSLKELEQLSRSSGRVQVLDTFLVKRDRPTPGLFIGKGKVEEIHLRSHDLGADVAIFGQDLSASQQMNLEEILGIKVIDRTQLILDIFAQRAHSEEGKVQVELAQLEYLLPRLAGKGILLSRLGGGIGTRGPGEQKLEMDRRRIRLRIGRLNRQLTEIRRRRGVVRQKRKEEELPSAALVGYTNVGKTTLLNALTQAGAPVKDQLFTTLDPLTRRIRLPNHQPLLISDTVGFLHRLPHHLIEAFKATLEEVTASDLILHVMDAASPLLEEQTAAVHEVLKELNAQEKPILSVFNKVDLAHAQGLGSLKRRYPDGVFISALTGQGIPLLMDRLALALSARMRQARIFVPMGAQHWLNRIYREGQVLQRQASEKGIALEARVPHRLYGQLAKAGLLQKVPGRTDPFRPEKVPGRTDPFLAA